MDEISRRRVIYLRCLCQGGELGDVTKIKGKGSSVWFIDITSEQTDSPKKNKKIEI